MGARKDKVFSLPDAERIPKRWLHMKAQHDKRARKQNQPIAWKQIPLKVIQDTPVSIKVFKQLSEKLRSRMFEKLGVEVEFDPKKLVTYQPCVSASAVLDFVRDEKLARKKKAYVLGTESGPCIWNGNHRGAADLIAGRNFTAVYLDLTGGSGTYVYKDKRKK
jgi:hypothetical protein